MVYKLYLLSLNNIKVLGFWVKICLYNFELIEFFVLVIMMDFLVMFFCNSVKLGLTGVWLSKFVILRFCILVVFVCFVVIFFIEGIDWILMG